MFTSGFKAWIEEYDPYGAQRVILPKALFLATVATYVYWIFQPSNFQSYIIPFLVLAFYEAPAIDSYPEKERLLVFMTIALILISVSFYLVFPFKGTFFFFSVLVLALTYFSILKYFYALKNLTMLLLVNGTVVLSTQPLGSIQVAYTFVSSTLLAMLTAFICLKIYPTNYLWIWNKAMQKFIHCLQEGMDYAIRKEKKSSAQEVQHLGMARNYRKLIPIKYRRQAYRIAVNLRNIQHCLDSLYYEDKNVAFWHEIQANFELLRHNMSTYAPCGLPRITIKAETQLQHYICRCLNQVFIHWDKLCYLQHK
ncbi:hypothetical protein [Legionella saoudiensis]|uniref:hypothetical protein n=1 Tax=Legionella saoudiensis TaxID=1750561 RepID=UPI000730686C|nr:hypothetical protein [Legionella saoudiensis]